MLYECGWARSIIQGNEDVPGVDVSTDAKRFAESDVVVFHIPTAPPTFTTIPKRSSQMWIAFSMESDVNYPQQGNLHFMQRFDLTMTYRCDSDLPVGYLGRWHLEALLTRPSLKTAESPAVYFASNPSDRCGREDYVRELMHYLPVDSYGASLNNKKLLEDTGRASKLATIARYKFTLAFENSITKDYVTEKFFDSLIAGSVPVYRGAPNINEFAPGERCFIDASRFPGARELAEYLLYLDKDEAKYAACLDWKTRPLDPRFVAMASLYAGSPLERLAEKLSLQNGVLQSSHVQRDPIHQAIRWMNSDQRNQGSSKTHTSPAPRSGGF